MELFGTVKILRIPWFNALLLAMFATSSWVKIGFFASNNYSSTPDAIDEIWTLAPIVRAYICVRSAIRFGRGNWAAFLWENLPECALWFVLPVVGIWVVVVSDYVEHNW